MDAAGVGGPVFERARVSSPSPSTLRLLFLLIFTTHALGRLSAPCRPQAHSLNGQPCSPLAPCRHHAMGALPLATDRSGGAAAVRRRAAAGGGRLGDSWTTTLSPAQARALLFTRLSRSIRVDVVTALSILTCYLSRGAQRLGVKFSAAASPMSASLAPASPAVLPLSSSYDDLF